MIRHEAEIARHLYESDRVYFELGARVLRIGPASIAWIPGLAHTPAGCVCQRVALSAFESQAPEGKPPMWLNRVESVYRSKQNSAVRLYTRDFEDPHDLLATSGYACREEIGFAYPGPAPSPPGQVRLRPIETSSDWLEKLRLHEVSTEFSDGHAYVAREWVEIERRKCLTGRLACFLIERGSEFHGSVCLMRQGRTLRIKNLYLQPGSRGRGIGSQTLGEIFGIHLRSGDSVAVVYGVQGDPGERLYHSQNMVKICKQYEWTRHVGLEPASADRQDYPGQPSVGDA